MARFVRYLLLALDMPGSVALVSREGLEELSAKVPVAYEGKLQKDGKRAKVKHSADEAMKALPLLRLKEMIHFKEQNSRTCFDASFLCKARTLLSIDISTVVYDGATRHHHRHHPGHSQERVTSLATDWYSHFPIHCDCATSRFCC